MFVIGLFAICAGFLIACGGGGGGAAGGGTNGTNPGAAVPLPGQYLEFIGNGGQAVDPLNLRVTDQLQVQFVNYDLAGVRSVLVASNFTLVGTNSTKVSLSPSGFMQVVSDPNANFKVSATATVSGINKTLTQDCRVAVGTATVSGTVVSSGPVSGLASSLGIVYVQVDLYDQNLNRVGGSLTWKDGAFSATCPTSAKWLTLKADSISDAFFRSLSYNGGDYSVFGTTCLVALPTLHPGDNPVTGQLIVTRLIDGPPPPPTGCGH